MTTKSKKQKRIWWTDEEKDLMLKTIDKYMSNHPPMVTKRLTMLKLIDLAQEKLPANRKRKIATKAQVKWFYSHLLHNYPRKIRYSKVDPTALDILSDTWEHINGKVTKNDLGKIGMLSNKINNNELSLDDVQKAMLELENVTGTRFINIDMIISKATKTTETKKEVVEKVEVKNETVEPIKQEQTQDTKTLLIEALSNFIEEVLEKQISQTKNNIEQKINKATENLMHTLSNQTKVFSAKIQQLENMVGIVQNATQVNKTANARINVAIIGLMSEQEQDIKREFSDYMDIKFIDSNRSKILSRIADSEYVVLMTKFIGHHVQKAAKIAIKDKSKLIYCNGCVSELNEKLLDILTNPQRTGNTE